MKGAWRAARIRTRKRPIPHVTMISPFKCSDQKWLMREFEAACAESKKPLSIALQKPGTFPENKVVFIGTQPSKNLLALQADIYNRLKDKVKMQQYDSPALYHPHLTVWYRMTSRQYSWLKKYVFSRKSLPKYSGDNIRVTLLRNSIILREFNVQTGILMNRAEALGKKKIRKQPITAAANTIKPAIFITSDLHLDHANIIKYCKRPFKNVKQMNTALVNNWNNIVNPQDTVYFLGDLVYGRGSRTTDYWLKRLNGNIQFVKGNHERKSKTKMHENLTIQYEGEEFLLIHNDKDVPENWKGWIIHGHHHNNHPEKFPLVNNKTKKMNVSTENTDYKPMLLKKLIRLREQKQITHRQSQTGSM